MKLWAVHLLLLELTVGIIGCRGKTTTIPAGLDLFQTDPETTFFKFEKLPIPAGFFTADSRPFTGTVKFKGGTLPRSYFKGRDITQVDTIVKREKHLTLPPRLPASGNVPVEMIALSLVSEEPIKVQAGNRVELWDVLVGLSRHRQSKGTMTITKTDSLGGIFESQLVIVPVFRFIRQSDGDEKILDIGALELTQEMLDSLTLRASRVPWRHLAPPGVLTIKGLNDNFIAGAPGLFKETSQTCAHGVKEPRTTTTPPTCTVTAKRDDTEGRFKAQGSTNPGATVSIHHLLSDTCNPVNVLDPPFLPSKIATTGNYTFAAPTTSTGIPGVGKRVLVKTTRGGQSGHCCTIVVAGSL